MQFIIGGSEVEDFSRFAYQLSLRYVEVHVCGASIIAEKWALTAGLLFLILKQEKRLEKAFNGIFKLITFFLSFFASSLFG